MRQAIIWTNADPIHWRIYTALGEDELNYTSLKKNEIFYCKISRDRKISRLGDFARPYSNNPSWLFETGSGTTKLG